MFLSEIHSNNLIFLNVNGIVKFFIFANQSLNNVVQTHGMYKTVDCNIFYFCKSIFK